jgi:glycosyltransferase involved in cell wall biosynthesis
MPQIVALLLAFNQEKYVRDAIRDVLSQDLEDLKVILSDDCSSDKTFDIMVEEGSNYQGEKHLVVRRNPWRLGLNEHINLLLKSSPGDIIIPFAADDRFAPSRARILSDIIVKKNALLAHSDYNCIDADGNRTDKIHGGATFYSDTTAKSAATSRALFVGATAAWHRDIFKDFGPLPGSLAYEDLVLGFRASLGDRVAFVPDKLVDYRIGVGQSFRDAQARTATDDLSSAQLDYKRNSDLYEARLADVDRFNGFVDPEIINELKMAYIGNRINAELLDRIIHSFEATLGAQGATAPAAIETDRRLALLSAYLQKVLKPRLIQRLLFHKRGTPRYLVKRILFSSKGLIRPWGRVFILDSKGRPRRVFFPYLNSLEYLSLPKAHRAPWLE